MAIASTFPRHGRSLALWLVCLSPASCDVDTTGNAPDLAASIRAICDAQALDQRSKVRESALATFIATPPNSRLPSHSLSWCIAKAIAADRTATGLVYEIAAESPNAQAEYVVVTMSSRHVLGEPGLALDEICRTAGGLATQGFDWLEVTESTANGTVGIEVDETLECEFSFVRSVHIAPDAASMEAVDVRARLVRVGDQEWSLFWIGLDAEHSAVWQAIRAIDG